MDAQSVTFYRKYWTPAKARKWLATHGYTNKKIDITPSMLRFRQKPPSKFTNYRTLVLPGHVNVILGF